jgi:hypothetical protein
MGKKEEEDLNGDRLGPADVKTAISAGRVV